MANMLSLARMMSLAPPALAGRWVALIEGTDEQNQINVESFTATRYKIAAERRPADGSADYFPGHAEIDNISLVFYETEQFTVSKWLDTWRKQIYDPAGDAAGGFYGVPDEYKRTITLIYYKSSTEVVVRTETYTGCWPTDTQPNELGYTEIDGRLTVVAQFSVDSMSVS